VSPIDKVLTLLTNMQAELTEDFKSEATAYEKFACFCSDNTKERSHSIKKHSEKITVLSATIADSTQLKKGATSDLHERKVGLEKEERDLHGTHVRCTNEDARYVAELTDLNAAIEGLTQAIKSLKESKPEEAASLLSIRSDVVKTLMVADISSKSSSKRRKAVALLQVDPDDPGYDFHGDEIIKLCVEVLGDYTTQRDEVQLDMEKADSSCTHEVHDIERSIDNHHRAMAEISQEIDKLRLDIGEARSALVTRDSDLKEDELYLNDLTKMCQERANDYDQRSSMHHVELTAIKDALGYLSGHVKQAADKVNIRALFLQNASAKLAVKAEKATEAKSWKGIAKVEKAVSKSLSFLQDSSAKVQAHSFLARDELSLQEDRRSRAVVKLRREGQRLGSLALTTLATRAAADPFQKVKGLIQKLIERLLMESKGEASKKGFCDMELGKAEKDRDFRWTESQDLSADLARLEAKEETLTVEIKELSHNLKEEKTALDMTIADRKDERMENAKTLRVAKDGADALASALTILKTAYKTLAKGASFVQASPLDYGKERDENGDLIKKDNGPGFSGSYHGAQGSSTAVFTLLEQIRDDFDRTIRTTEAAEKAAQHDFEDYSQTAKVSLASKTTQRTLNRQDLATTKVGIETKTTALQTAVDLIDSAVQELELLKPTCIDTGMSFADRVEKREEELKALKAAVRILT